MFIHIERFENTFLIFSFCFFYVNIFRSLLVSLSFYYSEHICELPLFVSVSCSAIPVSLGYLSATLNISVDFLSLSLSHAPLFLSTCDTCLLL